MAKLQLQTSPLVITGPVYGIVRNSKGQPGNGSIFADYVSASRPSYAFAWAQEGTASGFWQSDIPTWLLTIADNYTVVASKQIGATPADSDTPLGQGTFSLNGTGVGDTTPPPLTTLASYLAQPDADTLAGNLLPLPYYGPANNATKTAALVQATYDIDNAMRYQGRKYDQTQSLEFPRLAYVSDSRLNNSMFGLAPVPMTPGRGNQIWDWDYTLQAARVPQRVLMAVLYQANYLLNPATADRLEQLAAGLTGISGGGVSETYNLAAMQASGGLCQQAMKIMQHYQLRQGRIL